MESPTEPSWSWHDVAITYVHGEVQIYRVYSSMWNKMKDVFYSPYTADCGYIIGYPVSIANGKAEVSRYKTYINMSNMTHVSVVDRGNGKNGSHHNDEGQLLNE
jgi:hypothetical protein